MMTSRVRSWPSVLVIAGALAAASAARADQFVLLDVTYSHQGTSHMYFQPAAGVPTNWVQPIDYAEGTAYIHLEVLKKPTTNTIYMTTCLIQGGSDYACTDITRLSKEGTYTKVVPFPKYYQHGVLDWTKGFGRLNNILKDDNYRNVNPGEVWTGAPNLALYYPQLTRLRIIVVSKGGTYVPPKDDGGSTSADAGVDRANDGAAGGGSDGRATTADVLRQEPAEAAGITTRLMDASDTPTRPDAAVAAPAVEQGDPGSSRAAHAGGCALAMARDRTSAVPSLFVLALLGHRCRRRLT